MQYSEESLQRIEKIKRIKDLWVIPYASKFDKKHSISDLNKVPSDDFRDVNDVIASAKNTYSTAWRIVLYRSFGKISFAKLQDSTWEIQIMFSKENCKIIVNSESKESLTEEMSAFKFAEKLVDVWDFIWVKWELFITHKWELTLFAAEFEFLSKAIRPLPEKFHWINDQEAIYRQRYLDLISNKESYDRFVLRSKFVKAMRDFYHENGFTEIETPVLWSSASGAAAAPFISHHNDFGHDFFLRISPETNLKKATVWRFERVFEVARDFRNEWSDPSHLQEFTMVEHYAVFWDFNDNMKFTEDMFEYLFEKLNLNKIVKIKDKEWVERDIDFSWPWERIDYIEWVKKASWIDIEKYNLWEEETLRKDIKDKWIQFEGMDNMWVTTLIDYLFKKVLRPNIKGPAFVYNYPKAMQPLARVSDVNPKTVEQFQVIVNGWELLKAYSELVDPLLQKANFEDQAKAQEKWDTEATSWDDDFVLAMEYWMPPQSGWWMWVDRAITLLTGQENLRDSVLFPLMKPDTGWATVAWKSKETKIAVAIINQWAKMESWQKLNTIAHLTSAFWARNWKNLLMQDEISTQDWEKIKLNIQHAIVIKQSVDWININNLIKEAKSRSIEISEFTREMISTTDDKKVIKDTLNKNYDEIEYLWVLVFWNKKEIDEMTKWFELYS
jgi:lysyl-tRNA synthetase, class II